MEPLVALRGVCLTLGGKRVLRDVSWEVRRGEGWLVTGPNGAGKTSLLRILAGQLWPDSGRQGGKRVFHFDKTTSESPIGLEKHIAWLSPETHQRFARLETPMAAGDVILTGFANTLLLTHRPTSRQRLAARRLASQFGLTDLLNAPFAELSQGQQRRVLLARTLAPKPRLLVLDEFSDGLDRAWRQCIGAEMAKLLRSGSAVVVATHRAGDALPGLTRSLVLKRGSADEATVLGGAGTPVQGLLGRSGEGPQPLNVVFRSAKIPTLSFDNASIHLGDHRRVKRILHHINWTVLPNEHWAVFGPNGSGKSTLLRAIYGDLPVARGGRLLRFGKDGDTPSLPAARRRMGYVSPALQYNYAADISALEVVASGFQASIGLLQKPTHAEISRARIAMRQLRIKHLANHRWGSLSFGETRLVLLARALAPCPRLLLLDEPCDSLSHEARTRFLRALGNAALRGAQVIIAAHRQEDLPACVNRILRLRDGTVVSSRPFGRRTCNTIAFSRLAR